MSALFVLVEHRQGELRDITFELLSCGAELAGKMGCTVSAILLGSDTDAMADTLKDQVDQIIVVNDDKLTHFNADAYQAVLSSLITAHKPAVVLMGQTGFGVDLAPALAVQLDMPYTSDCYKIDFIDGQIAAWRQMYGGKVNAKVAVQDAPTTLFTVRASSYAVDENPSKSTEILQADSPLTDEIANRKFVEYVEAAVGDVDIGQADIVIGVGRGIKEKENIPKIQELADTISGVVACSRPVVDAGWLEKNRQVGSSGKTIKPKLYIALGISGAFQHTAGIKGADTVVAVNKDANAPIFGVADYGIVEDLLKVVPVLTEKLKEMRAG